MNFKFIAVEKYSPILTPQVLKTLREKCAIPHYLLAQDDVPVITPQLLAKKRAEAEQNFKFYFLALDYLEDKRITNWTHKLVDEEGNLIEN